MGSPGPITCLLLGLVGTGGTQDTGFAGPAPILETIPHAAGTLHDNGPGTSMLTVDEALALCFPECKVTRGTDFLRPKQVERIVELSGSKDIPRIVHPYEARDEKGTLVGTAWFDSHRVRSKRETLMIAIDPSGRILRVEVLAFAEPRQYLPSAKWYGQLKGKGLTPKLSLKGDIRNMAGATLTARATVKAARRALAIQLVLSTPAPVPAPAPVPPPTRKEGRQSK